MIDQMQQKTYCPYAFKGLAIEQHGDIKPCCRYDTTNDQKIPNTSSLAVSYTHLTLPTIYSV